MHSDSLIIPPSQCISDKLILIVITKRIIFSLGWNTTFIILLYFQQIVVALFLIFFTIVLIWLILKYLLICLLVLVLYRLHWPHLLYLVQVVSHLLSIHIHLSLYLYILVHHTLYLHTLNTQNNLSCTFISQLSIYYLWN